jgi:hypothetical protein
MGGVEEMIAAHVLGGAVIVASEHKGVVESVRERACR